LLPIPKLKRGCPAASFNCLTRTEEQEAA